MSYILVLLIFMMGVWLVRQARKDKCRWQRLGDHHSGMAQYECTVCGVTLYSHNGKAPSICKKITKNTL